MSGFLISALKNKSSAAKREKELSKALSNAEHTELKASSAEREEGHAKQLAQLEEQKATLSEQFKVLANCNLYEKNHVKMH